jgi:hypothetical protein
VLLVSSKLGGILVLCGKQRLPEEHYFAGSNSAFPF